MNDIPKTNSVNNVNAQPMSNAQAQNVNDNKPSDDKKMKKSTQLMIGASALAVAIFAGVMLHKGSAAKKAAENAAKEAEKLKKEISNRRSSMEVQLSDYASEEELAARFAEIDKLPQPEQLAAYDRLNQVKNNIYNLKLIDGRCDLDTVVLRGGRVTGIPKNVQEAMGNGEWMRAGELFEEHVQSLPNTFRPKNVGETVEETISNVLGEGSKVKPHTYDLSKEGPEISSLRNCGGYYDVIATKDGVFYEGGGTTGLTKSRGNIDGFKQSRTTAHAHINEDTTIIHGVNKDGKYVTILNMPDTHVDTSGNALEIDLGLISRDGNMTPAQKDLLSLAEHPEKFNPDWILALTEKNSSMPIGSENLDYNFALSIIQSMAKG